MPLSAEWLPQILTRYCGCTSPWGVQEEKRYTGTSNGELKGPSVFISAFKLPNGLGETAHIHNTEIIMRNNEIFLLIKEHTQHVSCRYWLHSHPHQWHGSFTPCLEPWIQEADVQQNGTAQTLQTFHQKAGELFPLSVSRIHFLALRQHEMTLLVPSEIFFCPSHPGDVLRTTDSAGFYSWTLSFTSSNSSMGNKKY